MATSHGGGRAAEAERVVLGVEAAAQAHGRIGIARGGSADLRAEHVEELVSERHTDMLACTAAEGKTTTVIPVAPGPVALPPTGPPRPSSVATDHASPSQESLPHRSRGAVSSIKTTADLIRLKAKERAGDIAIVQDGLRQTLAELDARSSRVANVSARQGSGLRIGSVP